MSVPVIYINLLRKVSSKAAFSFVQIQPGCLEIYLKLNIKTAKS